MKRINRGAVLFLALFLGAASFGLAQRGERRGMSEEGKKLFKELRSTFVSWAQKEAMPQLREWKGTLDDAMSAEDLAKLNELRAESTQLRNEKRALAKQMREAWKAEGKEARGKFNEERSALKERRNALMEQLKPLAERYAPTLKQLGEEAKVEAKGWKKEAKSMFLNWMSENKEALVELEDNGGHFGHKGLMKMFRKFKPDMKRKAMVARFMLWDGNDFLKEMEASGTDGGVMDGMDFR